ncbi:HDOD domain-containing protein [Desulfosarcina sp. OttesenSCG-928-B08]|nr:HDOD domain-containing protein [Desulfosarcina sp. OttesenSCG-928-B08]
MRVECNNCGKVMDLPDNRLPMGKKVSFPCPACKTKLTLDLRGTPEQIVDTLPEKALAPASTGKVVLTPLAERPSEELDGGDLKRKILGSIKDLPAMPKVIYKAREIMDNPMAGFKEVAEVIEADQAIAAKVLQVANSAYYGLSGMVSSIHQATVVLGHKTLEQLIILVSSSSLLGAQLKGYRMNSGDLWKHALSVALCSQLIAKDRAPVLENDAFSVGLIHDAGKLVLDRYLLQRKEQVDAVLAAGASFLEAEQKVLGFDHTEMASDLCAQWKLPENHISAMRHHHRPSDSDGNQLAFIVHTANYIAMQTELDTRNDARLYTLDSQAMDLLMLDETDLEFYQDAMIQAVAQITESMGD